MGLTPHPERYARLGVGLVVLGAVFAALGIGVYTGMQHEFGGLSLLFYGVLLSFVFTLILVLPSTFDFLATHVKDKEAERAAREREEREEVELVDRESEADDTGEEEEEEEMDADDAAEDGPGAEEEDAARDDTADEKEAGGGDGDATADGDA